MDSAGADRASILHIVQLILDDERAIELVPRDLALLVLMRNEIDAEENGSMTLAYSSIQALHSRLDTLEARDSQGAERRLSESLNRLIKSECLAKAEMMRLSISSDTEYQVTPVGDAITEWHITQSTFSGEPLTAIFRAFITQLARIAEDAEKAETEDDWQFDVVQQMQHALKSMLSSIQRHQKELDRQHATLREFVPTLLARGSEESIGQCESQLNVVTETIHDLQEAVLSSTNRAFSLLEHISLLSAPYQPKGVEQICDELGRRLNSISLWTTQRATDWVEHHNIVHSFLRSIIRVDRQRRITDALKRAVSMVPDWTLEVADETRFIRMRDDATRDQEGRSAPKLSRAAAEQSREIDEVSPDELPSLLQQYLFEELAVGEALASSILSRAASSTENQTDLIPHFPWLMQIMGNLGEIDHTERTWKIATSDIEIEELRVTK